MRWEVLSTRIQESGEKGNPRKRFEALLIRLYAAMLRLYPATFRTAFGDEMRDVFAMTLREATGTFALLTLMWREMIALPMNLMAARHRPATFFANPKTVWRARQVTRWSSLTLSLFIIHSIIQTLLRPNPFALDAIRLGMFFVLLFLTSVSMLLALRWERLGGLLTMIGGIAVGCFLTFYIGYFHPVEVSVLGLLLIGLLWALPFVTLGMLFCQLSQCPVKQVDFAIK